MSATRRDFLKVLGIAPAIAATGPSGIAALTGAVIGTAITRPPKPVKRVVSGQLLTAQMLNDLVDAVNNANGFTDEARQ